MIFENGFFAYHPQNSVIIGKKSPENFGTKENRPPKIYGYSVSSKFRQGVVRAKTFETAKVPLKHPNRQMILRVAPN